VTVPAGERPRGFPASERLRTDREFREVVRKGARLHTEHYTVYRDSLGGGKRQVGISAGKRAGGAVARNRAKRLLRESARALAHRWIDRDMWVVLVAKASIVDRSLIEVRDDIERALIESGVLEAKNIE